ncbi:MAG: DUF6575 domain-containing protein [Candidatus Sulfotelmatobacter sp.]
MMFLGQNSPFGELSVQEVFISYDGPRLFVAENAAEQKFLFNCLLSSGDLSETWLVVPISEKRLSNLKAKMILLRDAFLEPELGIVFEVVTDQFGNFLRRVEKLPTKVPGEDLPEPGIYLEYETEDHDYRNAVFEAKSLGADIVLLHLYPNTVRHEAPANIVAKLLTSAQDYLSDRLSRILPAGDAKDAAPFDVSLVGTFAGSFGIELAVRGSDHRIGKALKDAVADLGAALEPDAFVERMTAIDSSASSATAKFIQSLKKAKTDLRVETASRVDATPVTAAVPLKKLTKSLSAFRKRTSVPAQEAPLELSVTLDNFWTVEVELIGLNLRTKTFELRTIADSEAIRGTMAKEIFSELEKAELPSRYRVVLERAVSGTGWKMISATKLMSGSL